MAQATIGALRVNLGIDSAQFSKGLKKAETGMQKFGRIAKTGLLAAGAAAAGAATAMGLAVKGTINAADDMSKAAQKFGIPIEELSRLKYAGELAGVSMESMGTGVQRLSANMNDAKNGIGEGMKAFEQLGISVTDAEGNLKSSTAVMAELADKFAEMPDGAEKTALAMDLMGRSGANMIPLLNGGADALHNTMAEADNFSQVFTEEMGKSAEAFNDNISKFKGVFASLVAGITKDLLPHLEQFSEWLVSNAPQIREFATTAIQMFADVAKAIGTVGAAVGDAVAWFQSLDEGLRQFGENVRSSLRLLADDILVIFRTLPGQMLEIGKQILQGLWDGMKSKFATVKDGLTGFVSDAVGGLTSLLKIQSPSKVMYGIGVNIMQGLSDGMASMQDGLSGIMENIGQSISSAFQGVIDGSKSVKDAIGDVLKSLAQLLINQAFTALLGGGAGGGGILAGLFGGLPKFAQGGTILPGGSGGVDGQIVALRKSPSEQVDIYKPGQDRGGPQEVSIDLRLSDDLRAEVDTKVRQGVQVSIQQSQKITRRNFAGMSAEAQARGR